MPSIELILILRTTKRHAVLWRRTGDDWLVLDCIGSAALELAITTEPIPLDELYAPLDLDEAEDAGGDATDPA